MLVKVKQKKAIFTLVNHKKKLYVIIRVGLKNSNIYFLFGILKNGFLGNSTKIAASMRN